jgi:hypothetical protein
MRKAAGGQADPRRLGRRMSRRQPLAQHLPAPSLPSQPALAEGGQRTFASGGRELEAQQPLTESTCSSRRSSRASCSAADSQPARRTSRPSSHTFNRPHMLTQQQRHVKQERHLQPDRRHSRQRRRARRLSLGSGRSQAALLAPPLPLPAASCRAAGRSEELLERGRWCRRLLVVAFLSQLQEVSRSPRSRRLSLDQTGWPSSAAPSRSSHPSRPTCTAATAASAQIAHRLCCRRNRSLRSRSYLGRSRHRSFGPSRRRPPRPALQ